MPTPDTRPSILLRLRDPQDREAWQQFASVYRGVIYRVAARYGMQDADAADLEQEVLIRISRSIERFEHDPAHAKFRTWLGQVIRSAIVDQHRKRPREQGTGLTESEVHHLEWLDEAYEEDCRSEILRWASRRIRGEFTESSWQAFWKTTIDQRPVTEVAKELGKSIGAIYTSRSRVIRRLREVAQEFDSSDNGFTLSNEITPVEKSDDA
ncbi:MAG: sigma-70 family RNA polymerase sigma factor [Planctomycetota bacterium]